MLTGRQEVVVLLCRGCCCGTANKHPRTDHDAQVATLEAAVADNPVVDVRLVDCLDECDRSNVAVIRRPSAPRKERDVWLGGVLAASTTGLLAQWLQQGAPADSLPQPLRTLVFRHFPPRKAR